MNGRVVNIARDRRAGQAVIEFISCLVVLLLVIAGMIHFANMGRATLSLHGALRGRAGLRAMESGAIGAIPQHISDWDAGPDELRYTVDDRPVRSGAIGITAMLSERSVKEPSDWAYVAHESQLPFSMVRLNEAEMRVLDFAHAEDTIYVELSSVLRQLVYDAEEVAIKEQVWMPLMRGLY